MWRFIRHARGIDSFEKSKGAMESIVALEEIF
jgi:hypothetical protein